MNKQQIISTLNQPHQLNDQTLDQMKEILDEYPFFQAGRMLWVMNLHLLGHIRYNNELKLAAAHIASRARLFDLLNVPAQTSVEQSGDVIGDIKDSEVSQVATEDYFVADEVFETESGEQLDFSRTFEDDADYEKEDIKYAFPDDAENIILPSADLLGFEMSGTASYNLSEDETANWDEARSFYGWLNVLKNQPAIVPTSDTTSEGYEQPDNKKSLIDSFLAGGMKTRRIVPVKPQDKHEEIVDISAKSLQENEDLMTETLANIYIKQQHFLKAIDIFNRLRLKYPEKSIYFARRIKELEDQINNQ